MLLVVDDNKDNRTHLARRLARDGYQVLTAESGAAALETLEYQPVTLVLLDVQMPDMDGLEVLRRIRETHDEGQMPVLMVSANTDTTTKVTAMNLGATDYLGKPVEYDFLLAKLRQTLRTRESGNAAAPAAATGPTSSGPVADQLAHYTLKELLGEGGMGKVYRATDNRLLRDVALKVMSGELKDESLQRFINEARAVARVSHPNVVTIYEISESPSPFLAMELVEGMELEDYARTVDIKPAQATAITKQIAEALAAVHERGILHRDLKPSNIMIYGEGKVKVMDFGLAKIAELDQKLTKTGDIWGTPQFMSPEHFDPSFGEVDAQSDLFALGGIFYQLLTGQTPFRSVAMGALIFEIISKHPKAPQELKPAVSAKLSEICLKALAKEKSQRFASAAEMASALGECL
jgi:serine/threonine protein kinase/CheY-like chemotaxis protein